MIKVLHAVTAVGVHGGVQGVLWNYYKNIDEDEVRFDFITTGTGDSGFADNFINKKSKIYKVTQKRKSFFKHCREIFKVLKSEKFDIIHIHQDFLGYTFAVIAWLCGIKVRIMHTHKANIAESFFKRIQRAALTFVTKAFSTHYFACGEEAAKWTFGKKFYNSGKVYVLKNAIELTNYFYDAEKRIKMREECGFADENIVIGNVARFTYLKNHELLINIFKKLYSKNNNYRLLLLGEGSEFEKINKMICENKLNDAVLMVGNHSNVSDYLQAMDMFVLTSRCESLGLVLIEAQANGLSCVTSHNVPREVNVENKVLYVENYDDHSEWIEKIESLKNSERTTFYSGLQNSGYDIKLEAGKLVEKYKQLLK